MKMRRSSEHSGSGWRTPWCAALAAFSAIGAALLGGAFAQGNVVRVAIPTDVRNFDPFQSIATHERAIQQNIFDTLIDLDRDYNPTVPALAVSWRYLDDTTLEIGRAHV